jgi:hypothetical protein
MRPALMKIAVLRRAKPLLAVLGWAASTAALTLATIFQGYLLPKVYGAGGGFLDEVLNANPVWLWIFYLGNFGICILAALVISDLGTTVIGFFVSYGVAAGITYMVLSLPDFIGVFPFPGVLEGSAVTFTFGAFFPLLLLVNLVGTIVGAALSERLL